MHARLLASLTATALALSGLALVATPADAAGSQANPRGRVTAHGGLASHQVPTAASPRNGGFSRGRVITLNCKVHGSAVRGNDLWYSVHGSKTRWVSARYVSNIGAAPRFCGDGFSRDGSVHASRLNRREGPSLASHRESTLRRGDRVEVVCHLPGLKRDGVVDWYQLGDGSWVSARYVSTPGRVALCA